MSRNLLMSGVALPLPFWAPPDDGGAAAGAAGGKPLIGGEGAAADSGEGAGAGDGKGAAGADDGKGGDGKGGDGDGGKPAAGKAGDGAGGDGKAGDGKGGPAKGEGEGDDPDAKLKAIFGDDEKLLAEAKRYGGSGKEILKGLVEAKAKLRTRNLGLPTPPKDATPEQLKTWREENGFPSDGKGYGIEGLDKLPKEQQEIYGGFLDKAAAANLPPAAVKAAVSIYQSVEAEALDKMVERDQKTEESTTDALIEEFGSRAAFRQNVAMADNFIAAELGEVAPLLMKGRLADGTIIGSHPAIIKMLVKGAREGGYSDTYVPNDGSGGGGKSIDDRVAEIKAAMGDKEGQRGPYWSNPKMQAEYVNLIRAQQNQKSRGKN